MRAPLCCADPAELLDLATIEDPHPFFARVRAQHAISRVGDTGVLIGPRMAGSAFGSSRPT
jgi:hypothetical protein